MTIQVERSFKNFPEFPAWKVLDIRPVWNVNKPRHKVTYTGPFSQTPVTRERWLRAEWEPVDKSAISHRRFGKYGFSVFKSKADAEEWARKITSQWTVWPSVERVLCKGYVHLGSLPWLIWGWPSGLCYATAYVEYIKFEEA
jgi:hypothetical protein